MNEETEEKLMLRFEELMLEDGNETFMLEKAEPESSQEGQVYFSDSVEEKWEYYQKGYADCRNALAMTGEERRRMAADFEKLAQYWGLSLERSSNKRNERRYASNKTESAWHFFSAGDYSRFCTGGPQVGDTSHD